MKKLLIVVTALVASYTAQAQSTVGVKMGLNYSNLAEKYPNDSLFFNKTGFAGGIYFNIPLLGKFLTLQPEVLYSNKGFNYNATYIGYSHRRPYSYQKVTKVVYHYLDIPLVAKIKTGSLFFEAGPLLSCLLNGAETSRNMKSLTGTNADYSDLELGYVAGLGFVIKSGVALDLRYNGSFKDFNKEVLANNSHFTGAHSSVLQVTLGMPVSK